MQIMITAEEVSEDGGRTWERCWNIIDAGAEQSDRNYNGVLACGCASPDDALSYAIEQGWLTPGRDE